MQVFNEQDHVVLDREDMDEFYPVSFEITSFFCVLWKRLYFLCIYLATTAILRDLTLGNFIFL